MNIIDKLKPSPEAERAIERLESMLDTARLCAREKSWVNDTIKLIYKMDRDIK